MGLGKTIQSMSILQWLKDRGARGPFLVIVPTSCLSQWKRELETWTTLDVVEYHGDAKSRAIIQEHEINFDKKRVAAVKFNVLLTTYEMLNKDNNFLRKFNWTYAVIDEAHRMKVCACKTNQPTNKPDQQPTTTNQKTNKPTTKTPTNQPANKPTNWNLV